MKCKSIGLVLLAGIAWGCVDSNKHPTATRTGSDEVAHPDAPLTANTRFAAGQLAESQGDLPRAIAQYQEAIKLDPNAAQAMMRLGIVYANAGQFDEAVGMWNRYIKVTNESAAGYANLGYTLSMAQRYSEAETAYKTAIAKDFKCEPARVNYGLLLANQGRMDEAIAQLQTVLTPAEAHYDLASVLESQGKIAGARAEYQQAIKLDPDMNDAKARLAALDMN